MLLCQGHETAVLYGGGTIKRGRKLELANEGVQPLGLYLQVPSTVATLPAAVKFARIARSDQPLVLLIAASATQT